MAVKFLSKQSLEIKSPQFYKVSLLNWLLITVIIINVVIGGFSGEDLTWLARVTVQLQVSDYNFED